MGVTATQLDTFTEMRRMMSSVGSAKSTSFTSGIADVQFLAPDTETVQALVEEAKNNPSTTPIIWHNVALFVFLHSTALVGAFHFLFVAKWLTCIWMIALHAIGGVGVTCGAHRLWAHRSFKARRPTRIALMIANTIAFEHDIIDWSRDHRGHHKWTDTDADPHNIRRGFFFSHIGWLMMRKHDKVKEMGARIDLSDLFADPVLAFQRRHYKPLSVILGLLLPAVIPVAFWGESRVISVFVNVYLRLAVTLNTTWLINSAAHTFGYKPYDAAISPADSTLISAIAAGEGGHNYHHTFPQDYRTSELSVWTNWTRGLIEWLASIGQAYDLRTASDDVIKSQMAAKGDGHRHYYD